MHHDLYNMTELMCSCDLIMILDATASSQYSACSTLTEQVQCPLAQRQQRNVKADREPFAVIGQQTDGGKSKCMAIAP